MTTSNKIAEILKSVYSNSINQQLNQQVFHSDCICIYCGIEYKSLKPVFLQVCDECLETECKPFEEHPFEFLDVIKRRIANKFLERSHISATKVQMLDELFHAWHFDRLRVIDRETHSRAELSDAQMTAFCNQFNELSAELQHAYFVGHETGRTYYHAIHPKKVKRNIWEDLEERIAEVV